MIVIYGISYYDWTAISYYFNSHIELWSRWSIRFASRKVSIDPLIFPSHPPLAAVISPNGSAINCPDKAQQNNEFVYLICRYILMVLSYNACIRFVVLTCVRFFFEAGSRPLTTESFDCDRIERRDNSIIFCNYIYKAPSSIISRKTALATKHLSSSSVISSSWSWCSKYSSLSATCSTYMHTYIYLYL